ncbi:hypothetical protein ACWJJH_15465 [Endozoicomonadaceae bacterium StTr2]
MNAQLYAPSHRHIWHKLLGEEQQWLSEFCFESGDSRSLDRIHRFICQVQHIFIVPLQETFKWVEKLETWKQIQQTKQAKKKRTSDVQQHEKEAIARKAERSLLQSTHSKPTKSDVLRQQRDHPRKKKHKKAFYSGHVWQLKTRHQRTNTVPDIKESCDELSLWEISYQKCVELYVRCKFDQAEEQYLQLLQNSQHCLDLARVHSALADCALGKVSKETHELEELQQKVKSLLAQFERAQTMQFLPHKEKLNKTAVRLSELCCLLVSPINQAVLQQSNAITQLTVYASQMADEETAESYDAAALLSLIHSEQFHMKMILDGIKEALDNLITIYQIRLRLWQRRQRSGNETVSPETIFRTQLESDRDKLEATLRNKHSSSQRRSGKKKTCKSSQQKSSPSSAHPIKEHVKQDTFTDCTDISLDNSEDSTRQSIQQNFRAMKTSVTSLALSLHKAEEMQKRLAWCQPLPDESVLNKICQWFRVHPADLDSGQKPKHQSTKVRVLPATKIGEMQTQTSCFDTPLCPNPILADFFAQHQLRIANESSSKLFGLFESAAIAIQQHKCRIEGGCGSVLSISHLFNFLGTNAQLLARAFPGCTQFRNISAAFTEAAPNPKIWGSEQILPLLITPWQDCPTMVFDASPDEENDFQIRLYGRDGSVSIIALTQAADYLVSNPLIFLLGRGSQWSAIIPATTPTSDSKGACLEGSDALQTDQ